MIKQKDLKVGYYYYSEHISDSIWGDSWRFIGKIVGNKFKKDNATWFPYKIVKGNHIRNEGEFSHDSIHFESIKGVAKTIEELRIYML